MGFALGAGQLGAAALLVAAAYWVGARAGRDSLAGKRRRTGRRSFAGERRRKTTAAAGDFFICECGASLSGGALCGGTLTPSDLAAHRLGRRHVLNMKLVSAGTRLRVCEHWAEYREVIDACVRASDRVAEIGCGRGVTTALLADRCAAAVGFDLSEAVIGMARARFPSLRFEVAAAADVGALRRLGPFDVLFVDINGSRELQTVLPLLEAYEAALSPRLIVVKNTRLRRLLLKAMPHEAPPHEDGDEDER